MNCLHFYCLPKVLDTKVGKDVVVVCSSCDVVYFRKQNSMLVLRKKKVIGCLKNSSTIAVNISH